jgi:hypothetical protein
MTTKTVVSSLKSSSDRWDNLLGVLVSMPMAGHPTTGDLAALTLFARERKRFTLSQISMILNSMRVYVRPWQTRHEVVTGVRIADFILRCQGLSIMDLAFIITHFIALTSTHPSFAMYKLQELGFPSTELRDGKIFFPHLYDDAVLLDLFDLFNSFPSLIHKLASHSMQPKTCGAFAIHFLIRLYQASPVMYWRIMGQLSHGEVRKWAGEVSEEFMDEAAHVILDSQGITGDRFRSRILSDVQIQHYDQSLDPNAVDLDKPMLHVISHTAAWQNIFRAPTPALKNVWLAIHAQTANRSQKLPIPVEIIQWVDHPIPEMIALKRLSSPHFIETAFINLCLHSTSFNVLLPALGHHLQWLRGLSGDGHAPNIPSNGMSWNEMHNVLSNALRVLLSSDLKPNQLSSFWRLVYPLSDTQWAELPDSWHLTFLQCFFSLIHQGPAMSATASAIPVVGISGKVSLWDGVGCFTDSH